MSRPPPPVPSVDPTVIAAAPELALVAVLDEVVSVAVLALCAAHPAIAGGDYPSGPADPSAPAAQRAAWQLIRRLYACRDASARYRRTTLCDLQGARTDADVPF